MKISMLNKIIKWFKILSSNMKKTLTIKTISFKHQKNQEQESPLHATCRLLSRTETIPSQRHSLGPKLTKRFSEKNNCKNTIQKTSLSNSRKLFQNIYSENQKRQNKSNNRYLNNPSAETVDINQSAINFKLSSHHFHPVNTPKQIQKTKAIQSKNKQNIMNETTQLRKNRIKSQPNNSNDLKKQLIHKVSKKLELLRKMTIESDTPTIQPINYIGVSSKTKQSCSLFDKMYDHCLKKLNKKIALYQKNLAKSKDQKYFELKFQNSVLTKELIQIRKNIMLKIEDGENQSNMGIVGNLIDLNKTSESFKISRKKLSMGYCEKKNTKNKQANPFSADTRGWEVGEKHQLFYLCQ